ncbi:MAG: DUF4139 domain-containing protein [Bryobacteraceae bacterium]
MRIWPALLIAVTVMGADLPVRQVILYKHGVGYFERFGELTGGASARLDFKASEMDDVLKSLTVVERGSGKVTALRYDSSLPLIRKLGDFPFRIGERKPLSELLDELKGSRVELRTAGTPLSGVVVSGRQIPGSDKERPSEQVTLLLDSGEIQTVDLGSVLGVKFSDLKLQQQFRDYLMALSDSRSQDRRSVYIDSTDSKPRSIAVNYVIPSAVWKSSYRLIFDKGGEATLEGWAIVDNTTGEDWSQVQLSLVSGRPISFISRLYEPKFITRRVADLPDEIAQGPVLHEGAIGQVAGEAKRADAFRPNAPAAPAPQAARMMSYEKLQAMRDEGRAAQSSIAPPAAGRELGDLFEYRMPAPVTVRKNESAMLPFLQQKFGARKLLIYSDESSAHPHNAAELANTTGKTLDGGPITVLDEGAYGGEALFETLKGGDKRLISYAVDLGTRITTRFDSKSDDIRQITFNRGVLLVRNAIVETKTYTMKNVDAKAKTLILEHPLRPEYKLLQGKPQEKTANAYRFEVPLAPASEQKYVVSEERVLDESYAVTSLTPDAIAVYARNKALSPAGRQQLQRILDLKRQIAETERDLRDTDQEIDGTGKDQERLRQNIESLNRVPNQQQQVQVYARQLAEQETRIAALRDKRAQLQRRRNQLNAEAAKLIETTEF